MERLTEQDWKERFDLKELHPRYKRLAAYEDTQLTPEQITLIFSDCDKFYFIGEDISTGENRVMQADIDDEIRIQWGSIKNIWFNATDEYDNCMEIPVGLIGIEYFLTQAEAEQALKGSVPE